MIFSFLSLPSFLILSSWPVQVLGYSIVNFPWATAHAGGETRRDEWKIRRAASYQSV